MHHSTHSTQRTAGGPIQTPSHYVIGGFPCPDLIWPSECLKTSSTGCLGAGKKHAGSDRQMRWRPGRTKDLWFPVREALGWRGQRWPQQWPRDRPKSLLWRWSGADL